MLRPDQLRALPDGDVKISMSVETYNRKIEQALEQGKHKGRVELLHILDEIRAGRVDGTTAILSFPWAPKDAPVFDRVAARLQG